MSKRGKKQRVFEQVELQVEGLAHDGRGMAKREGKLVFVEGALPQEIVRAQVRSKRSRFDEAITLEVIKASPLRLEPQCEHAQFCGGCSLQYMQTDTQLGLKQSVLLEQLQHFGGIVPQKIIPAMRGGLYHYRRKARLGVRYVEKRDQVLVGFREKRTHFITDIKTCQILDSRIGNKIQLLCELIRSLAAYRNIPQIEVAIGDDQVALVFRHMESLAPNDVKALTDFGLQQDIEIYLQPGATDSVHKIWPAETEERLSYRLTDYQLEMRFHPMDFTQVNADINRSMVKQAVTCLDPKPGERVLDLFCGLGNFTLPLARSGATVVGVEGSAEMVARGCENAQHNGLGNVEFYAADLTQDLSQQPWGKLGFDKVLIDPPRSGALEIVRAMVRWQPVRIVYVSCNPATLARDAGELKQQGYELVKAGILDMFPQTKHVESIAVFERNTNGQTAPKLHAGAA